MIQTLDRTWQDKDTILLHATFQILVDYVECECAWMDVVFDREKLTWKIRLKHALGLEFRSREHGVEYLQWERELTNDDGEPTEQAKTAKQIYDLYWWWKDARKFRIDPWSLVTSEWNLSWFSDESVSEEDLKKRELWRKQSDEAQRLEDQYYQEDSDKMKQLIDLRRALWT
jgi:hypothetical protein